MIKHKQLIFLIICAIVGLGWFYQLSSIISTPHLLYLRWFPPVETSFMERDESGVIFYKWVPLSKISPYLRQAVITAEDGEFYFHEGVDVEAVKKAAKLDWKKKKFKKGASTITMQLARNLYLSPTKSLFRKFREVLIALKLDREFPKDRVLEIYLNVVEWGNGIYGAEAAAKHYFGKSAAQLTRHEAAFLAAILPRPKFYDKHRGGPYLQRRINVIESMI